MKKNEKLWEHLSNIDDDLLRSALETDSKEKLAALQGKGARRELRFDSPFLRKLAVSAACLLLAVALSAVALPALWRDGGNTHGDGEGTHDETLDTNDPLDQNDPFASPDGGVIFDCLDKVNYYAGLKMIRENSQTLALSTASRGLSYTGVGKSVALSYTETLANEGVEEPADFEEESYLPPDEEAFQGSIGSVDISGERLLITTAVYFELDVTEADEFLASKVGTGRVNVMMTDLYIGVNSYAMITFKNGETYFSCLSEGRELMDGENRFYSHLYIKRFALYKDTTNGVSSFQVHFDESMGMVTEVNWIPYNRRPAEAPVYRLQVVAGSSRLSHANYEFSLLQLEGYYNETAPDGSVQKAEKRDETITVTSAGGSVTAIACPWWEETFDAQTGTWNAKDFAGVYGLLLEDQSQVPTLVLDGDVSICSVDAGALVQGEQVILGKYGGVKLNRGARVFYMDGDGKLQVYNGYNGIISNLDELLPAGEWFVVVSIEWRDGYVPSEYLFERHCNEYLFKLVVE